MTLKQWAEAGWLKKHPATAEAISGLLAVVDRELSDASQPISPDGRFGHAYNAGLQLCTMLLSSEGYRAERSLQHYRTIQAAPLILGDQYREHAVYLDTCRKKRNIADYESVGAVTESDADELIRFVAEFREDVVRWLREHHPELLDA